MPDVSSRLIPERHPPPAFDKPNFRLHADESLAEGVRRVTLEQLRYAGRSLEELPVDVAVHEARKSIKRVRAVLRLTRRFVGDGIHRLNNGESRDAGRRLGPARDAAVLLDTFDGLMTLHSGELSTGMFEGFRRHLVDRRRNLEMAINETAKNAVLGFLGEFSTRVADWSTVAGDPNRPALPDDFGALAPGIRRVYRRGRKRMALAEANPGIATFHLWRRSVRYLRYQVQLISESSEYLSDNLAPDLADLAVGLGTEHDLAVLSEMVHQLPDLIQDAGSRRSLLQLLEQDRLDQQALMEPLGRRIYVATSRQFVHSLGAGWENWKGETG